MCLFNSFGFQNDSLRVLVDLTLQNFNSKFLSDEYQKIFRLIEFSHLSIISMVKILSCSFFMDHINKNNLSNKEQFEFQNKKFSTDAVLFFTEIAIENHENGKNNAAIFLDLSKAFNSISHKKFCVLQLL